MKAKDKYVPTESSQEPQTIRLALTEYGHTSYMMVGPSHWAQIQEQGNPWNLKEVPNESIPGR
jgi:hypothetical protein